MVCALLAGWLLFKQRCPVATEAHWWLRVIVATSKIKFQSAVICNEEILLSVLVIRSIWCTQFWRSPPPSLLLPEPIDCVFTKNYLVRRYLPLLSQELARDSSWVLGSQRKRWSKYLLMVTFSKNEFPWQKFVFGEMQLRCTSMKSFSKKRIWLHDNFLLILDKNMHAYVFTTTFYKRNWNSINIENKCSEQECRPGTRMNQPRPINAWTPGLCTMSQNLAMTRLFLSLWFHNAKYDHQYGKV